MSENGILLYRADKLFVFKDSNLYPVTNMFLVKHDMLHIKKILASTESTSFVLLENGILLACGYNADGQLGLGDFDDRNSFERIGNDVWIDIAATFDWSSGIKRDGTLWEWGRRRDWNNPEALNSNIPIQVGSDNDWAYIVSGASTCYALKENGTLWAWGYILTAANAGYYTEFPIQIGVDNDWINISSIYNHIVALKRDGTMWMYGTYNTRQGVILNPHLFAEPMTQIGDDSDWAVAKAGWFFTVAIKTDGTLWAFGVNWDGQLGLGEQMWSKLELTQIGFDNDWKDISVGWNFVIAIKNDGTLWSWGANWAGQLGRGFRSTGWHDDESTYAPEQVGDNNDWKMTSSGNWHSLGLKNDGTLWSWGDNWAGQLGLGWFPDWDASWEDRVRDVLEPTQVKIKNM